MDDYAGRVLADRYRLPLPPSDEYELTETRAFDTYSGQEVLLRQVPLPEVVEAEVLDADGLPDGFAPRDGATRRPPGRTGHPTRATGPAASARGAGAATRRPADPAVRRAVEAAQAAARIPDHPRLDQVFDVFAEGGSLWIASELVAARPLAALLAEQPLTPYRAAEVASDILMALRVLHGHGWVHRNITARTVLVCDDGRVMLTGLAVGAAEEALCGYDPVPPQDDETGPAGTADGRSAAGELPAGRPGPGHENRPDGYGTRPGGGYGDGPGRGSGGPGVGYGDGPGRGSGGPGVGYGDGPGRGSGGSGVGYGDGPGRGSGGGAGGRGEPGPYGGPGGQGPYGGSGGPGGQRPYGGSGGPGRQGGPGHGADAGFAGAGNAGGAGGAGGFGGGRGSAPDPAGGAPGPEGYRGPGQYPAEGHGGGASGAPDDTGDPGGTGGVGGTSGAVGTGDAAGAGGPAGSPVDPEAARRAAIEARAAGALPPAAGDTADTAAAPGELVRRTPATGGDVRAARAGAIAAYRAGARAAARVQEAQQGARAALPGARPPAEDEHRGAPPGRIADPYGVRPTPWNTGAPTPPGAGDDAPDQGRTALPAASEGALPDRALPPARLPAPGEHPVPAPPGGTVADEPAAVPPSARWDEPVGAASAPRGPGTALAAERARQARMTVVGPVTERWAPEQAGPVHENWQLAAPIGPATDLWALGALLFRAVQGHAPYPEDSTAELVQLVCAEPPAFAEECGALRPVVESLLRQDPTERLDFEELGGWLRSLVRSAPEPEAGAHVVAAPPADPARLPVIRRRGELVRRRRAGLPAHHGRHKRSRGRTGSPRSLGRVLLLLVLLLLAGTVAYAMLFMPKAGQSDRGAAPGGDRTGTAGQSSPAPSEGGDAGDTPAPSPTDGGGETPGSAEPQTTGTGAAHGFALRKDAAGFQLAVPDGWTRTPKNTQGQVTYAKGGFELIVVPGRDSAAEFGSDPMVYQREREGELQAYRSSSWATSSGLRTIQVGGRTMAEGQFTWNDAGGRELFVRNVAILLDGRYHVLQVRGPAAQRDKVDQVYDQASASYRYTG